MSPHPGVRRSLAGRASTERRTTLATTTPTPRPSPPPALEPPTPTDTDTTTGPILYTAEQAAELLQVRPSWLRRKATAHAVPCRHVGKHLRFARADIDAIAEASAQPARQHNHFPRTN
jgi:excisionase family DNA binding protein